MLLTDTLVVIGLATASLGTIHEADGMQQHSFWVQNKGAHTLVLKQGYTSCGCTQIDLQRDTRLSAGDSLCVTLRFNPRGKGGEFYEQATIVYGPLDSRLSSPDSRLSALDSRLSSLDSRLSLALTGTCITSEETLLKQFPIRIDDHLRLSMNRFDLGYMQRGQTKERGILVLHRDENNRKERIPIRFSVDESMPAGLQHITRTVTTRSSGKEVTIKVLFDVIVQ